MSLNSLIQDSPKEWLNARVNNLTIDGTLNYEGQSSYGEGLFIKQLTATATAAGITALKDFNTGESFQFDTDDIIFHVMGIASSLTGAGNIEVGLSLTDGGAVATSLVSDASGVWVAAKIQQVSNVVNTNKFIVANLTGGVTAGNVRILVQIWRRSLTD